MAKNRENSLCEKALGKNTEKDPFGRVLVRIRAILEKKKHLWWHGFFKNIMAKIEEKHPLWQGFDKNKGKNREKHHLLQSFC